MPFLSDWDTEPGFGFFTVSFIYEKGVEMNDMHFHNYIELTRVEGGKIVYSFLDKEVVAGDGDMVIVNHIQPHAVKGTDERALVTVIGFKPEFIWKGADEIDFRYIENFFHGSETFDNLVHADVPYCKKVTELFGEICAEYDRKEDGYKLMIKAKLMELLTILYRHHTIVFRKDGFKNLNNFKNVVDFIYENAEKPLTLSECAAIAECSPSYFSFTFHKMSGKRFSDYLSSVRVDKACEMLLNTDLSINDIRKKCGLNNPSNFNKLFMRLKKTTPVKYRKEHKK